MPRLSVPFSALLPAAMLPAALLAGCGQPANAPGNGAAADMGGGLAQPGPTPTPDPLPSPAAKPLNPPAPGTPGGLPDDRTPVSEAPFAADSAQGAAQVVQTYYAAIEAGDYAKALSLWRPGNAPAADAAGLAGKFAQYSEYHANIGAPGEVDAGAGQRYVTVPVQPYARRKADGEPVYMIGTVTLHLTVIDGAPAAERSWHIQSIAIHPAP